jgi:hypothetical protein
LNKNKLSNVLLTSIEYVLSIYHANNSIFASKGFQKAIAKSNQTIPFCITRQCIQDLADLAQAMLAHASHKNLAGTAHLWLYAFQHRPYV